MTHKKGPIYEFEGFELVPSEGLLVRNGEGVALQPKAFATLVYLVEQNGHLVEKSALIERVWADTFVEEAAVSRCIWQIRNALGVDSKDQKFIQTVPKRGYRFVAKVTVNSGIEKPELVEVNASDSETPPTRRPVFPVAHHPASSLALAAEPVRDTVLPFPIHADLDTDEPKKPFSVTTDRTAITGAHANDKDTGSYVHWYRRWPLMVALGVLLLGTIGLGGYFYWEQSGSSAEIRSVAVMPFVNETGDPQFEYLSDGMTDTLISSLSELPNVRIKSRTSVFRYKGRNIDPRVVGEELGVQAIVNGRVTQRD